MKHLSTYKLFESSDIINLIKRRVSIGKLEEEFEESVQSAIDMSKRKNMDLDQFIHVIISMTIDGIHWMLISTTPDESQWYNDVYESLKSYYKDKIESEYRKITND